MFSAILAGCAHKQSAESADNGQEGENLEVFAGNKLVRDAMMVPDSVATAEQLALKKAFERVMMLHTHADGNRWALSVGKEYFAENGIPVEYYDSVQAEIASNNAWLDKIAAECGDTIIHMAADLEHMKQDYLKYLEEVGENGISYSEYSNRLWEAKRKEVMDAK